MNPRLVLGSLQIESLQFQFTIISLIRFYNYSLFPYKSKIYVGYKMYLTNRKYNEYLFVIRVKRVLLNGSFRLTKIN